MSEVGRPSENAPKRVPKRHEAQCKACQHGRIRDIERDWVGYDLADTAAAKAIGCSVRAWKRHASYVGLYEKRISRPGKIRLLTKAIHKALEGPARVGDLPKLVETLDKVQAEGVKKRIGLDEIMELLEELREAKKRGISPAEYLGESDHATQSEEG